MPYAFVSPILVERYCCQMLVLASPHDLIWMTSVLASMFWLVFLLTLYQIYRTGDGSHTLNWVEEANDGALNLPDRTAQILHRLFRGSGESQCL